MSLEEINDSFNSAFPPEALPEVLKVASELAGARRVTKSSFVRESLEKVLGKQTGDHAVSCYDLARDLAGSVKGLPRDLADNPKHMKGFGE